MPTRLAIKLCLLLALGLATSLGALPLAEAQRGARARAAPATERAPRTDSASRNGNVRPRAQSGDLRRTAAATTTSRAGTGAKRRGAAAVFSALERGSVGRFNRLARSDPFLRSEIEAVLRDRALLIDSAGGSRARNPRRAWVPLASDRRMRRVLIRSILHDVNDRSARLKALIKDRPNNAVWDTVFIGAGIHTAAGAAELGQTDPDHRMLVIEAGTVVSSNFANLGETIAINSSSRAETGRGIQPFGRGNNNPAVGPVGVPDVSGEKWPAADALSDVATISLHTSGADVLTRSRVSEVRERGPRQKWPARYQLKTSDGLVVYSNNVVVASGLGKPALSLRSQRSNDLIQRTTARVDYRNPDRVPRILFYNQAMTLANLSSAPRDPYRAKPNGKPPRIVVVGGGDSGRTFLELLYGLAPGGAYDGPGRLDRAQRGEVGNLQWVVGENGPRDCKQFLDTTRARYSRIAPSIKSGRADLVNASLADIAEIKSGRDKGRYRITYSNGRTAVADRVILATGFQSDVGDVLRPILPSDLDRSVPLNASSAVSKVRAEVAGARSRKSVAKQVNGQDVFLIGPVAGSDLVGRGQTVGISENLASIKFLVPYTAALSRNVLAKKRIDGRRLDTSAADAVRRQALTTTRGRTSTRARIRRAKVATSDDASSDPARTGIESFVLRLEMSNVLDGFTYRGLPRVEIQIEPAPGGMLVSAPGLNPTAVRAIRDRIEANAGLMESLQKFTTVGKALSVTAKVGKDNAIELESLALTY